MPISPEIGRLAVADGPHPGVNELMSGVLLVDHHVHSIATGRIDRASFVQMLTESDRPAAAEATGLDSQIAFAVRRWCAPLLGLPPHVSPDEYLEHRLALSNEEVGSRLLAHCGFERLLVDTGFREGKLLGLAEFARLAAAPVDTIVRLEALAERVALSGPDASGFGTAFSAALETEASTAIGLKSIIAYRHGLDFEATAPSTAEVEQHAGTWLREVGATGSARLVDPILLRFIVWEGAATGKPLQIHTGYGDSDLDLRRSDPLLLTDFLRATEGICPVLLLHTYPFQRHAGYLAEMFPHVFLDVGLAVNHAGPQSAQVIAESLEIAPFTKILFSSDAWGLPELHLLGSWLFRRGMARVVGAWVARGDWSMRDAERVIELVAGANARRVYGLPAPS
jgi:predicted TIM-barrel fold metal-dependent hydrolase